MPLTKRSYSFHGKISKRQGEPHNADGPEIANEATCVNTRSATLKRKIKTRGQSFIGRKGKNSDEENREITSGDGLGFRSSVRLRSFRKRKMADRDQAQDVFHPERAKALKMDPEDDIQRRIDDQIKMREGAMRLISACGNLKQALDASKNLNAINARVLALMSALQKKRSSIVLKDYNKRNSIDVATLKACQARVAVRDIRIPLMWKDDVHYKERSGDPYLLYYMFCFLKMGDQVLDTMLTQIDHKDTDVTFDGPFIFEKAAADFKLDFEIYYTVVINPDRAYGATPMRTSRKGGPVTNIPKYCLAAHAQFDVRSISDRIVTTDLIMGGQGAHATAVLGQKEDLPENQLNLWGQVCLQLSAQPVCMLSDQKTGSFYLQEGNGGQSSWEKFDCILRQCSIECTRNSLQNGKSHGQIIIKLRKNMRVTESKVDGLGKNHVLILESDGQEKEPVLGFDDRGTCIEWKSALEDCIVNIKAWGVACDKTMDFQSRQIKLIQSSPKLSFYDQILITPVNGAKAKTENMSSLNGDTDIATQLFNGSKTNTDKAAMDTNDHVYSEDVDMNRDKEEESVSGTCTESQTTEEEPEGKKGETVEILDDSITSGTRDEKATETQVTCEVKVHEEGSDKEEAYSSQRTEEDIVSEDSVKPETIVASEEAALEEPEDVAEENRAPEVHLDVPESSDVGSERDRVNTSAAMSAIAALDQLLDDEENRGSGQFGTIGASTKEQNQIAEPHSLSRLGAARASGDEKSDTGESDVIDEEGDVKKTLSTDNLDDDELLDRQLSGVEHDDDELLNQKLNVYNGIANATSIQTNACNSSAETTERKPFTETEI